MVVRREGDWLKKMKALNKKKLIDTDNSMVTTRGKERRGRQKKVKGGINGDGRRLDLGW